MNYGAGRDPLAARRRRRARPGWTLTSARRQRRAGMLRPVPGDRLRFPCDHDVVRERDLPVRDVGIYLFDCFECGHRFSLFVHGPSVLDQMVVCEWDVEARALIVAVDASPVRGHRLPTVDVEPLLASTVARQERVAV